MTYLFIAFTANMVINMCNVKCRTYPDEIADLIIITNNRIPDELITRVIEGHLFRNCYINNTDKITIMSEVSRSNKLFELLCILITTPQRIKIASKNIAPVIKKEKYNRVFVGTYGDLTTLFLKMVYDSGSDMRISVVDEGTGSYVRTKEEICFEPWSSSPLNGNFWVYNLFKITSPKLLKIYYDRTDTLYLYYPELYMSQNDYTLKKIIPLSDPSNNKLLDSFTSTINNYDISEYMSRKYIYFFQNQDQNKTIESLIQILNIIMIVINPTELIFKNHPWFDVAKMIQPILSSSQKNEIFIDKSKTPYIFEFIYPKININEKILITESSTAVLSPKFLYSYEPYVIFTYKLSSTYLFKKQKMDAIGNGLKKIYKNPEKIFIPESLDELKSIIINIK